MRAKDILSSIPKDEVAAVKAELLSKGVTSLVREWAGSLLEVDATTMEAAVDLVASHDVAIEVCDALDLAQKPAEQEPLPKGIWVLTRRVPDKRYPGDQGGDQYLGADGYATESIADAMAFTAEPAAKTEGCEPRYAFTSMPLDDVRRAEGSVLDILMDAGPEKPVDVKALMASMLQEMQHCEDPRDILSTAVRWAARVGVMVPGELGLCDDDERNTVALVAQGAVDGDYWEANR